MTKKNFLYNDKKYEKSCQLVRQAVWSSGSQAAQLTDSHTSWSVSQSVDRLNGKLKKIFLKYEIRKEKK